MLKSLSMVLYDRDTIGLSHITDIFIFVLKINPF